MSSFASFIRLFQCTLDFNVKIYLILLKSILITFDNFIVFSPQFLPCFSIHGLLFFNHYCFTHTHTLLSSFSIVYVLYVGFTSWDWIPYQGSWPGEDSFSLSQQLSLPESLHSRGTGWWEFNPSALVCQLVVPFFRSCLSDHIAAISWLKLPWYIYIYYIYAIVWLQMTHPGLLTCQTFLPHFPVHRALGSGLVLHMYQPEMGITQTVITCISTTCGFL